VRELTREYLQSVLCAPCPKPVQNSDDGGVHAPYDQFHVISSQFVLGLGNPHREGGHLLSLFQVLYFKGMVDVRLVCDVVTLLDPSIARA